MSLAPCPVSDRAGTMAFEMIAAVALLSLGMGLGTIGTVLWLKLRVTALEAELEGLRTARERVRELEERLRKLEAENTYLQGLLEERGSRLKLLEDRLAALEAENKTLRTELQEAWNKLHTLEDLVVSTAATKPKEPQGGSDQEQAIEQDLLDLKILALYRQGYSIREIAKVVGLSKSTVHRRLKKLLG